jgi:hypothetical protein
MNAVRYPFINTRQGKSLSSALWKCVQNPLFSPVLEPRNLGVTENKRLNGKLAE